MTEKIHDLQTALESLRIKQTVSFDDCQKIMAEVNEKTGFMPPSFEISGNQWCALINLAVARFAKSGIAPQAESVVSQTSQEMNDKIGSSENVSVKAPQAKPLTAEQKQTLDRTISILERHRSKFDSLTKEEQDAITGGKPVWFLKPAAPQGSDK